MVSDMKCRRKGTLPLCCSAGQHQQQQAKGKLIAQKKKEQGEVIEAAAPQEADYRSLSHLCFTIILHCLMHREETESDREANRGIPNQTPLG